MARLQILLLPEATADDRPPFALIVDEYQPTQYLQAPGHEPTPVDEFAGVAEPIGARAVLVFQETVTIPANEPTAPGGGDAQLIHAHEQTRLALCDALLLSRDTTWHQLTEQAAARHRETASLYRQLDAAKGSPQVDVCIGDTTFTPEALREAVQCSARKEKGGTSR
ncbi:hypothetical protein ABZ733_07170 [Streptomyces longwoodensis]|uniref:hypothetical protein n=1 Tax=Streptomyces longwoodensis TaxID=68231 RepID=UPI0033DD8BDD